MDASRSRDSAVMAIRLKKEELVNGHVRSIRLEDARLAKIREQLTINCSRNYILSTVGRSLCYSV